MALHLLTTAQVAYIKRELGYLQSLRQGRPLPVQTVDDEVGPSTDIYIAYPVDSGGIAARSTTTPGSGACYIYRIVSGGLEVAYRSTQIVYNLSDTALSQTYFIAVKDKYGTWLAANAGGGGGCPSHDAWHDLTVFGTPTGGTFDADFTINSVQETMTFNYNDSASAVQTEMLTHSELSSGDVAVYGGPFPDAVIRIQFEGNQATTDIDLPLVDYSALTGGSGVAVIASMARLGVA